MLNSIKYSKVELITTFTFFIALTSTLYFGYVNSWLRGAGDNATYTEITYNIAQNGKAYSNTLFSAIDFQQSPFFAQSAEEIQKADFSSKDYSNRSSMKFHLTPLQYIIAPFALIFKAESIWSLLTAFSFSSLIFLCYFLMRSQNVAPLGAGLFTVFLSTHPAWSASLFGQFYIDRFFLVIGFIFFYIIHNKLKPGTILIWAIICSLLIEKFIIITGVYLLAFTLLNWVQIDSTKRKKYIYISFFLFFYSTFIIKFILSNYYYGSFISLHQILYFYKEVLAPSKNLIIFSFFNILPLIIFSFIEWKLLFLALILMGPNLAGSIGGAEKSGWMTHYHTTYLPALFLSMTLGFVALYKISHKPIHRLTLYVFTIVYTVFLININPYTLKFSPSEYLQNGILKSISLTKDLFDSNGVHSSLKKTELELQANIPIGSSVSIPETLCVSLAKTRKIYLYPQGIKDVDFVVTYHEIRDGKHFYKGQFYAQSPEEIQKINDILNKKLLEYGFDLDSPIVINNIAVLKRKKTKL